MEVIVLHFGSNMNNDIKILVPEPAFNSSLMEVIFELEKLRHKELSGTVPPYIFFQLKEIFQILETLGSSRLEGNHTTLSEYVEKVIEKTILVDESQKEIENIERAMRFVESNTDEKTVLSKAYFSEIHKIIVDGLTPPPVGEGSRNPGNLRKVPVSIGGSSHTPPDYLLVPDYFEEFISVINTEYPVQSQLLVASLAHHRFAYIHPFDNGNGRLGRLLNYAFLIKLGFNVKNGRIINPSSVFFSDRDRYNEMLGKADSLKEEDLLEWCEYFLTGLKNETEKIDSLLEKEFVKEKVLKPAIKFSYERQNITEQEKDILLYIIQKDTMSFLAKELEIFGISDSKKKSNIVLKLREQKILRPISEGKREYTINFVNSYILRGIIKTLEDLGFVDDFLIKN